MRKITLWLFSTVAAVVLLFSYRTSTNSGTDTAAAATVPATTEPSTSTTTAPSSGASPSPSASSSTGSTSGTKTYTGSTASTRWGDVQVSITVTNGKITSVAVPTYPTGNGKDEEINAYALPILKQETVTAQNANIDTVSGATDTSDGYTQSLQAALDAAHLA